MMMFAECQTFVSTMAPFASRKVGPEWFTRPFPSTDEEDLEDEYVAIWESFLHPRIMPLRFKISKNQLSLIAYQPNLVSQQFGIVQSLLSPIYSREKLLLFYNADYSDDAATKHIGRYVGQTVLTLFDFNLNFMCSPNFKGWWRKYNNEEFFDEKDFDNHLRQAFKLVFDKIKKGNIFLLFVLDSIIRRPTYICFLYSCQEDQHKKGC